MGKKLLDLTPVGPGRTVDDALDDAMNGKTEGALVEREARDALNMKLRELCECTLDTQGPCIYCWSRQYHALDNFTIERLQAERDHFEFAAKSCAGFSAVALAERDLTIERQAKELVEAQKNRKDQVRDFNELCRTLHEYKAMIASLQSKLAESEKDAGRWHFCEHQRSWPRYSENEWGVEIDGFPIFTGATADEAIDAAIAALKEHKP